MLAVSSGSLWADTPGGFPGLWVWISGLLGALRSAPLLTSYPNTATLRRVGSVNVPLYCPLLQLCSQDSLWESPRPRPPDRRTVTELTAGHSVRLSVVVTPVCSTVDCGAAARAQWAGLDVYGRGFWVGVRASWRRRVAKWRLLPPAASGDNAATLSIEVLFIFYLYFIYILFIFNLYLI